MEILSTHSEGKLEDSSIFYSQNFVKEESAKTKRSQSIQNMRKTKMNESRIKTLKNFQMHSSIKPREQKITSIFIKSKYWKRKKFIAVSPNVSEIQVRDKLVIFNNEQIETYYNDLQPEKIFSLSRDFNRVVSIIKNKSERVLEIDLSSPYENKQHTFKFLIDHFRKVPDPLYQKLYAELRIYQTFVTQMYFRLHSISKQIQQQDTYHNEVLKASEAVLEEVKTKMFNNIQSKSNNGCTFFLYKIQKVNYESKTYDLIQLGFSYDLMNLLSQDEEKNENYPLYTYNNLLSITKQYEGQQRIITQARILEAINSGLSEVKDIKIILQTLDSIDLNCSADVQFIYPSQVPSWMGKQDINAQVWKFTISPEQLQQVNQLREQCNTSCEYSTSDNIEYSISRDLFFSKFYPNHPNN